MAMIAPDTHTGKKIHPQRTPYLTIREFEIIAEDLPDRRLELIKGELTVSPVPEPEHQHLASQLLMLCAKHIAEIGARACSLSGSNLYFELPVNFQAEMHSGPSVVNPDAAIPFEDYHSTQRCPPALLVFEVLSLFSDEIIERDLLAKIEIYAALEIPAYWIIDRRDQSVWVHTQPRDSKYTSSQQLKGDEVLAAPGLEFLQLTPAQIFAL